MRMISRLIAMALACVIGGVGASQAVLAQPRVLEVPGDQDWQHKWTNLTVPPLLKEFVRAEIHEFAEDQLNVSVQLFDKSKQTSITIYIFRPGAPNISIWADRAVTAIVNNPRLGSVVEGQFFRGRFTPLNGSGIDSAFHAVTPLTGTQLKSTGVSIFAHDGWLVKVRASSSKVSDTELTNVIGKIISALNLGQSGATYPAVEFIENCEKSVKFNTEVKLQRLDGVGQLLASTLTDEITVADLGADDEKTQWCRDEQSRTEYGVYRRNDKKDPVIVALGDAGIVATISDVNLSTGLGKLDGYVIKLSDGVEEITWPFFDKLPHPGVIAQNYGQIPPTSKIDVRPGGEGGKTIILSPE